MVFLVCFYFGLLLVKVIVLITSLISSLVILEIIYLLKLDSAGSLELPELSLSKQEGAGISSYFAPEYVCLALSQVYFP